MEATTEIGHALLAVVAAEPADAFAAIEDLGGHNSRLGYMPLPGPLYMATVACHAALRPLRGR